MREPIEFKFRFYAAGDALNSVQAVTNLTALCRVHLPDRHEIEFTDEFRDPRRALADGIFMTPTLIKFAPSPIRRIVGSLRQTQSVLQTCGLGIGPP